MPSLYARLFRYRQRPNRAPLEDYLSESLSDYINRLSAEARLTFLLQLFVPSPQQLRFQDIYGASTLESETQYRIDGKSRIDIVILADGAPVIAIESKIGAAIGKAVDADSLLGEIDQLERYGRWLKQKRDGEWSGIICLLTHATPPPTDFALENTAKYGASPHIAKWSQITAAIREHKTAFERGDKTISEGTHLLSSELSSFLTENGMADEFAAIEDFSAAIVFLRSAGKIKYTYKTISDHLKKFGGVFNYGSKHKHAQKDEIIEFDSSSNLIWGWKYLDAEHPIRDLYFAYGIALKPATYLNAHTTLTDGDFAFLCIGNDAGGQGERLRQAMAKIGMNWAIEEKLETAVSFKPLSDFMLPPDLFAQKMTDWIDREKPMIESLVNQLR